jgi:hypothetical protein
MVIRLKASISSKSFRNMDLTWHKSRDDDWNEDA